MTGIKFLRKDPIRDHTTYTCPELGCICLGMNCSMIMSDPGYPEFYCELQGRTFMK